MRRFLLSRRTTTTARGNAHVVEGARRFVVTLSGGARHRATLVGSDRPHDIAVVRLIGATPVAASFADSTTLQVGDLVLAIGNPLGLRSSVTQGIVSSLNRTVSDPQLGDGPATGIGFAIPSTTVERVATRLIGVG